MKKHSTARYFKCPDCNLILTAYKKTSRMTKKGHLKNMWCPRCKNEHNFIQIREY
jgi:phage FluMu protein Com